MARRKAFEPFSPELLVVTVAAGAGLLWLAKRAFGRPQGLPAGTDAQGRPTPPLPPID